MSPTEVALLATHRSPIILVRDICQTYFGVGYERACQLAALNRLPVPTFRLWESQKAPLLVGSKDLAAYIDETSESARQAGAQSQI